MKFRIGVSALAFVLLAGGAAFAQEALVANVPFAFTAGHVNHPAGKYEVQLNEDQMSVQLTPSKGVPNVVLAITRLAAPGAKAEGGHLVFDKVGDTYFLAEAWMPGVDGIVLRATKEKHTHETINLHRK